MLLLQIEASVNMTKNSMKWSFNGAARDQGHSLTTSASHLPLSDHILRLVTQNKQVKHEQPQGTNSQILRDLWKELYGPGEILHGPGEILGRYWMDLERLNMDLSRH